MTDIWTTGENDFCKSNGLHGSLENWLLVEIERLGNLKFGKFQIHEVHNLGKSSAMRIL